MDVAAAAHGVRVHGGGEQESSKRRQNSPASELRLVNSACTLGVFPSSGPGHAGVSVMDWSWCPLGVSSFHARASGGLPEACVLRSPPCRRPENQGRERGIRWLVTGPREVPSCAL